ncbi:extracellular solute-binding protein [Halarcobacter sp.]|uniref:ABC transporter substrate-binding protein n=1 Tax=Halarcobacter sp. TaxID=2321133 RepID=UPI002AABAD63|nr:extracellular solute-binding protein [Halarcobacter sp.]
MKNLKLIFSILIIFTIIGCKEKDNYTYDEIIILTPNFDKQITSPIKKEALEYQKNHNLFINIVSPSWEDMPKKISESLNDENINYDIFVLFSSWAGSLLSKNDAAEIPDEIKEKIDWDDILPIYKNNILKWNKKYFFLPYDGDCIILYYRKDIFENPKYQKEFKTRYKYELSPPKTWKQYKDIAEFFNGWDWDNDGKIEYGFAESRIKGYGTTFQFLTKAAAYTKYPDNNYFYFDENMKPLINNEGFINALEDFVEIMKFAPPNIKNYSPAEVRMSFITGEVAMALDWADIGTMANNAKESIVKGKIAYAKLPGSNKTFNNKTNKWEYFYNAPSSINGNWVIVVNKNSENLKKAFDFAAHMTSKDITKKYVTKGESGINPSRYSHLNKDNLEDWINDGFSKNEAKAYLDVILESLENKNVISDLKIPQSSEYYKVFENYLNLVVKGELTPKEALNSIAKRWNQITNTYGLEKQKRFYKETINE